MYDWGCLGSNLLEGPWVYFGSASQSIQVVVLRIVDEQHPVPEKTYTIQQMAMEHPNHVHHWINYQAQLMLWCNNIRIRAGLYTFDETNIRQNPLIWRMSHIFHRASCV